MRNEIKICALILARGGSKRLPNKNIKSFNGKPLISWTVISAINSNRFDKVYCYSDDSKILDACIIEGAEVPFDRPKKVSGDSISSLETIKHFLSQLKNNNAYYPDFLVLLQPTSPLRTSEHIIGALEQTLDKNFDVLVSVKKNKSTLNNIRFISHGKLHNLKDNLEDEFKINLENYDLYSANGAIYIFNVASLDQNLSQKSFKTIPYVMSEIESFDIDTEEDFIISEQIFKINNEKN